MKKALLFAVALAALHAQAQQYPSRPIRVLVGFAAGGPTDVIARVIGQDMTQVLGQPIVVDNRTGANGVSLPAADLADLIQQLTDQMHAAAVELQFELAARLRDEIAELKKELRGMRAAGA